MKTCAYPGCTNEAQSKNAIWCLSCRKGMNSDGEMRRIGKSARKSVRPHENRVGGNGHRTEADVPHVVVRHCKVCYGLPWARMPGRGNDDAGGWGSASVTTPGEPYVCRGCWEPYAPEPKPELCGTIRSSAGSAVAHGELHGIGWEFRGRRSDGKRKGASK